MCDCDWAFLNGFLCAVLGIAIPLGSVITAFDPFKSTFANEDEAARFVFGMIRLEFMMRPEVDGNDADDIEGFEIVEIFLCNPTFDGSLCTDNSISFPTDSY